MLSLRYLEGTLKFGQKKICDKLSVTLNTKSSDIMSIPNNCLTVDLFGFPNFCSR